MVFTDIHINTTKTLFENNTFNDYLLIETLQKPYISIKNIDTHISHTSIKINIHYNIIFKNYEKKSNIYRLYYTNSSTNDSIDYTNHITWDFIVIFGDKTSCTITSPISKNKYYAFLLDYKQSNDTISTELKLLIDFSFKIPVFNIYNTMNFYKITPLDLVPNSDSLKVVSFNMSIIDKTLDTSTKGVRGILYVLTKSSYYDTKTTDHIFINGIKHYLLGIKETQNNYISLSGKPSIPVYDHFVSNLITNFEGEPFLKSTNTELVFLFQYYYTQRYYICLQESINIENTHTDLENPDYDISKINLNTETPPFKPLDNIIYDKNLIENNSLYVLKVKDAVDVIKF